MYPRNLPRIESSFASAFTVLSTDRQGNVEPAKNNEVFLFGTPGQVQMTEPIQCYQLNGNKLGFRKVQP
jgi:hypothetical protein